ncbi:hypothetical protein D9756_000356 [Leucocoprinus leucothites]|uniref:Uncharacterized protein n=1 Tax=Leucocoprinus leucothites TaxID=201217 RepID=A0A8H5LNW5_9AGAR|nr:hypothetical protein D9756_000356 [Leucoagaricus leucothites]
MPLINLLRVGTGAISRRFLSTTTTLRAAASQAPNQASGNPSNVQHTSDTYAKDVDTSPAVDDKVYRIDELNDNVQKPYEAPSGEFSRTGATSAEYTVMSKDGQPYAPKAEGEKQRYGGKKNWVDDKGSETSNSGEGPAGTDAGGRKAEGR